MAGWHHWLNGHGFGWCPGVGDRQGGLECCDSWGHKESDMTKWLNWTEWQVMLRIFPYTYWPFVYLFEELCIQILCTCLIGTFVFILLNFKTSLYILDIDPLSSEWFASIFFPFYELSLHFVDCTLWSNKVFNFGEIQFIFFICCLFFWSCKERWLSNSRL